jgi:hypothetical protein
LAATASALPEGHLAGERLDVVLTKRARTLALVDLAQLGQVDPLSGRPVERLLDCLRIHPLRCFRVALVFEVLSELLASDGIPFTEEPLDLSEDKRIALDRI